MPDVLSYNSVAGLSTSLKDAEVFETVLRERHDAYYDRKEHLDEFIVLGRYGLDSCGNFGMLKERISGLPDVVTYKDAFAIKPGLELCVSHGYRPKTGDRCSVCGMEWRVDNLDDSYGAAKSLRHKQCYYLESASQDFNSFQQIFTLAGFPIVAWEPLPNNYWPEVPAYAPLRTPWYKATTPWGVIKVGWRKRVMVIDWSETGMEYEFKDDVTKEKTMIHAWGNAKAVEYLNALRYALTSYYYRKSLPPEATP